MVSPEVFKELFLAASFFAVGAGLVTAIYNLVDAIRRRSAHSYSLVLVRVGTATIIGILAWVIRNSPGIPATAQAIAYTAGLLLIGIGLVGVLVFKESGRQA